MSTINDFGIPDVGRGILHPKHKHRWRVKFLDMGGVTDSKPLAHQLVTFERPKLTFEKIEIHRFNSRAFVAGKHLFDPINLTLEDDIKGTASRVLQEQLQTQQWLIGAQGAWLGAATEGSEYKFATVLEMIDGGRDLEVAERITLEGCFLENVDYGDLDYSSAEAVQINCILSFDHARQDLGGYTGAGQALGGQGPE